jgi:hypothetical protein
MNSNKKTTSLKIKVMNILLEDPVYRDDDQRLVARIIWESMHKKDITAKELLQDMFIHKKHPKPKSIERCSRLLQEKYPGLRGSNWVKRQQKAEQAKINEIPRLV